MPVTVYPVDDPIADQDPLQLAYELLATLTAIDQRAQADDPLLPAGPELAAILDRCTQRGLLAAAVAIAKDVRALRERADRQQP